MVFTDNLPSFEKTVSSQGTRMLANSTPFPIYGLPGLIDPTDHKNNKTGHEPFMNCNYDETDAVESFLCFPTLQQHMDHDGPTSAVSGGGGGGGGSGGDGGGGGGAQGFKKLSHNASERDRRKRLNDLYCTLQSLLPEREKTKKLSIPATVSCALKYIPELQKHVQKLIQRKEDILESIYKQGDPIKLHKQGKSSGGDRDCLPTVSASQVDNGEVVVQICASKAKNIPLSEVLLDLEELGLQVLNASAIISSGERVFYNLHLQVEETQRLEYEMLSQKLMLMYQKREQLQSSYSSAKAEPNN